LAQAVEAEQVKHLELLAEIVLLREAVQIHLRLAQYFVTVEAVEVVVQEVLVTMAAAAVVAQVDKAQPLLVPQQLLVDYPLLDTPMRRRLDKVAVAVTVILTMVGVQNGAVVAVAVREQLMIFAAVAVAVCMAVAVAGVGLD
jgi:hypothetical protein